MQENSNAITQMLNEAVRLHQKGNIREALGLYEQLLPSMQNNAQLLYLLGTANLQIKQFEQGIERIQRSLLFNPRNAAAHNNLGNALIDLKRLDEALASFDKALALKPDYPEAYNNRGMALQDLRRLDEALASYDKALTLRPDYAHLYLNRGNTLKHLNRLDEALASYKEALARKPDYEFLFGTFLHTKMQLCDWDSFNENLDQLVEAVSRSQPVTVPFPFVGLVDSPTLQQAVAKIYSETEFPARDSLGPFKRRPADGKVRVGYYSANFQNHAVAYLMAELFEVHDRSKFELFGFTFGPDNKDDMRQRVSSAFDRFIDIRDKSDREVAQLSRALGIDIAVDLMGYTQGCRPGIFAERAAPIQVNYLGFPGTMGAEYIDYLIADKIIIPPEHRSDYTEKVVYLPHSYQVNDSKRKISDRQFTKQEFGLPETGFVFCCFNKNYKILPATFDGWMRILKSVKGSVLWLYEPGPTAAENLRKEAQTRGVNGNRLVFAKSMPLIDEHLARHRLADLFLDTLPFNAHATASDSLWAGLPTLTFMGRSFVSRVVASLLTAIDLPELITHTQEEYEAKAIELASHPDRLREIKDKLQRNRLTTPLFDSRLFARHLEASYIAMLERYRAGERPVDIDINRG